MDLTVIGCSGSVPGPDGPASCYLVRAGDVRLLLDLGSGALGALQRHIAPESVDAVLLSHLHPDHCADLAALHVWCGHGPASARRRVVERGPIAVYGPDGVAARLAELRGPSSSGAKAGPLRPLPWGSAPLQVGDLVVGVVPVVHTVPAVAIAVTGPAGQRLVYTGDAGELTGALIDHVRGADLLLAEASWEDGPANPRGLHLSGRQAGELAARSGAGRLVLTHIAPWTDPAAILAEARAAFAGPVELAAPGARFDLG